MNSAGEIAARALAQPQNDSRADSGLPDAWVRALFAKLAVRYGHKWTAQWDSDGLMRLALDEWRRGLGGLTGEDIRRGLDAWQGDWPPSLPEFVKACRPPRQHAAHRPFVALPAPERHIDVQAEIRKLRCAVRPRQPINRWQDVHGMVPRV